MHFLRATLLVVAARLGTGAHSATPRQANWRALVHSSSPDRLTFYLRNPSAPSPYKHISNGGWKAPEEYVAYSVPDEQRKQSNSNGKRSAETAYAAAVTDAEAAEAAAAKIPTAEAETTVMRELASEAVEAAATDAAVAEAVALEAVTAEAVASEASAVAEAAGKATEDAVMLQLRAESSLDSNSGVETIDDVDIVSESIPVYVVTDAAVNSDGVSCTDRLRERTPPQGLVNQMGRSPETKYKFVSEDRDIRQHVDPQVDGLEPQQLPVQRQESHSHSVSDEVLVIPDSTRNCSLPLISKSSNQFVIAPENASECAVLSQQQNQQQQQEQYAWQRQTQNGNAQQNHDSSAQMNKDSAKSSTNASFFNSFFEQIAKAAAAQAAAMASLTWPLPSSPNARNLYGKMNVSVVAGAAAALPPRKDSSVTNVVEVSQAGGTAETATTNALRTNSSDVQEAHWATSVDDAYGIPEASDDAAAALVEARNEEDEATLVDIGWGTWARDKIRDFFKKVDQRLDEGGAVLFSEVYDYTL